MWPTRLSRQFLLVSGLLAVAVIAKNLVLMRQLARFQEDTQRLQLWLWVFASIIVVLVLLGAIVNYRLVTSRIRRLLEALDGLRRGEYPRLLVEGDDELSELVRGFNQAVEELRVRDEKLKSLAGRRETEVQQLSRILEEEREKLETVLQSIGEGVIVLDSENRVVMVNRRVSEIFGVPSKTLAGAGLEVLIGQVRHRLVNRDAVDEKMGQLKQDPSRVDEIVLELDGPGGQAVRLFCTPMRGADGKVLGRIATSLDLSREREVERLKVEFLSTISHELRTPLTSIKGSLGLIRGGAVGAVSADMRELLDIALTNADRLIGVINDILDIFQLERGEMRIRPGPMSLAKSIQQAVHAVANQAELHKISIEAHLPEDLPSVRGDPRRVEQVLVNLLSNAIKFSPAERKVVVSAGCDNQMVVVSVQDFGRGMSREFQSRLFSKFEHAQSALTRESQGAGLGLAICRHIVDMHGGRIWVESEEGVGTTFYFSLPAAERTVAAGPPSRVGAEKQRMPGPRLILVIDDDEDVARVISYVFESQGHHVIVAHNGREAIELARKHHPDMLTLDLVMPEADGYTVLSALRSNDETRSIPVICISVQPDSSQALSRGANYYLEKPVDLDKLREVAARALVESAGGSAE